MKNFRALRLPFCSYIALGMLALSVSFSTPAQSQAVYGNVRGRVTDISGEPISAATITVISREKGTEERATSNSSGFFTITHLLSDTYNIRAEAPGYKAREVQGETVYADQDLEEALQLEKGSGMGTVQLAEASSLLKTDRADVAITLSEREVQELPNFSRNFTAFELLTPGALTSPVVVNTSRPSQNPQQGLTIYQNGQNFGGSAFQLDGTDNRDPIAGVIVINPPLDSLSEIKITTQNFDAEFGQALAGLVTAQTRSGSNTWHGSLFEFRRSDWAGASPPNLQNSNAKIKNPFKINQFGGSMGGPIVANRLFVFGDYQGNRRALDFTKFSSVPTATVFLTCLDPNQFCDLRDYGKNIGNPNNPGNAFTCPTGTIAACIPHSDLSPQALALLQLYIPAPDVSSPNPQKPLTFQNFTASGAEPLNDDEFDLRIDQNVSPKLKLFGRYSFFDSRIDANGIFDTPTVAVGGTGISSDNFAGSSRSRNQSVSSGFDYVLSPRLTTDFRFGFYRYHVNVLQNGLNTTPAETAGITGLNLGDSYTSGMPAFVIQQPTAAVTTTIALGYSQEVNNCNCPLLENEQQFQWANNWTKLSGNHTFKWGADFRYARNLRVPSDRHRAGHLVFKADTSQIVDAKGIRSGGLGLASFLLGYASSFDRYVSPSFDYSAAERQHRYFFYGQDNWRVNSRFTLTYGLRWEIYAPQSVNGAGQGGFLDVNTGLINVAGLGQTNLQGNVKNSFDNFAPRFGFAYHALPHTVLRAGYGRSFDLGSLGAVFGGTVTQNLPVLAEQQLLSAFPGNINFDLRNPAPPVPNAPIVNGQIVLPNDISANVVPRRILVPTIDAWNVSMQQELTPKTSMELAYVGNRGAHVFPSESKTASYDLNQASIQGFFTLNPADCAPSGPPGSPPPSLPCRSLHTVRQPYFSRFRWTQDINYFGNNATDSYESLQAKLERRMTQSFEFRAAYTWSKGLGYAQDYFAIDPRVNYGPNDFDRTHSFTLTTLWDLPFGHGKPLLANTGNWLNRVIGGWELNTISYVYSGLPFTPTYNSSECAMDVDTGPCRPNLVSPVHITGNRNGYFIASPTPLQGGSAKCEPDPSNCAAPNTTIQLSAGTPSGSWERPAPGTFGNVGRNSVRGPSFFSTDAALLKSVALTERSTFQFRAVVANIFNRVNLGLPNACVDCPPIGDAAISGVIANIANGATMRQFEFALKLQF